MRIPVLVGGCGMGRTFLLRRLRERLGEGGCQYIDVERVATTPERLLRTVVEASPFARPAVAPAPAVPDVVLIGQPALPAPPPELSLLGSSGLQPTAAKISAAIGMGARYFIAPPN